MNYSMLMEPEDQEPHFHELLGDLGFGLGLVEPVFEFDTINVLHENGVWGLWRERRDFRNREAKFEGFEEDRVLLG